MDQFWVGIRGDLTTEQFAALESAEFALGRGLRRTGACVGTPPFKWETQRTYVPVSANDKSEATAAVATALALKPGDLVAHSVAH